MNGSLAQKFVEESSFNRRADAQLHIRKKFGHGRGKQMRRRMAEHEQRVGIFFSEDFEFCVALKRAREIHQLTSICSAREFAGRGVFGGAGARRGRRSIRGAGDERGARKARRNLLGDLRGGSAARHVEHFAVRQSNKNGIHEAFPVMRLGDNASKPAG